MPVRPRPLLSLITPVRRTREKASAHISQRFKTIRREVALFSMDLCPLAARGAEGATCDVQHARNIMD